MDSPDRYAQLKELLRHECGMVPSDALLESFLSMGAERVYADGETITNAGEKDPTFYVVKKDIVRIADMNGIQERTVAFGLPGTCYGNKHSFVKGEPSYYELTACGETVLLLIDRDDLFRWTETNHEGAIWIMRLSLEELYFMEYNNATVHNGMVRERFEALCATRPEIIGKVTQKDLASYLGCTPEYLCRIKNRKIPE